MFSNMNKHQHLLENAFRHRWLDTFIASESIVLGVCYLHSGVSLRLWSGGYTLKSLFKNSQILKQKEHLPQAKLCLLPITWSMDVHSLMPEKIKEFAGYQTPAKSNNFIGRNKTQPHTETLPHIKEKVLLWELCMISCGQSCIITSPHNWKNKLSFSGNLLSSLARERSPTSLMHHFAFR